MICKWFKKKKSFVNDSNISKATFDEKLLMAMLNKEAGYILIPSLQIYHEAKYRAKWMDSIDRMTHANFNKSAARLVDQGLRFPKEILGRNYDSLDNLVYAWMESKDHKKAILNRRNKYIGAAIYGDFVCVIFAR